MQFQNVSLVISSSSLTQTLFELPDVFIVAAFPERPRSLAHVSSDGLMFCVVSSV